MIKTTARIVGFCPVSLGSMAIIARIVINRDTEARTITIPTPKIVEPKKPIRNLIFTDVKVDVNCARSSKLEEDTSSTDKIDAGIVTLAKSCKINM